MQPILDHNQISQKINRLAHQIIENTFEEGQIYIGGIKGNGTKLAEELSPVIEANSTVAVTKFEIQINKDQPLASPITLSIDETQLENAYILLVDDVLNSGKTMQYALIKLLERNVKAIKTVALVDRKHRRYPIKADFVGLVLSTTLKNRVDVSFDKDNNTAHLL